jgi:hypothetical protein
MTSEQRIRGADAGVDSALLVTGHDLKTLRALFVAELGADELSRRGAEKVEGAVYRMDYLLAATEVRRVESGHG